MLGGALSNLIDRIRSIIARDASVTPNVLGGPLQEMELEDFYAKRNLLHRHVTTKDVANAVMYLLSEASSRTTGCVIPVDGGVAAAFPR